MGRSCSRCSPPSLGLLFLPELFESAPRSVSSLGRTHQLARGCWTWRVSYRVTSQLCAWKLREGQRAREPGERRCGREGRARPGRRHTGTFQRCRIPAARCEKPCVGKVESVLPPPSLPSAEGGRPKSLLWSRATMIPGSEHTCPT